MDGKSDCKNKAAFLNSPSVVWRAPERQRSSGKQTTGKRRNARENATKPNYVSAPDWFV